MTTNEFQTAIANKDFETAAQMVYALTESDCTLQDIRAYVEEGSYNGTETAESVATEYDELNLAVEGVDY